MIVYPSIRLCFHNKHWWSYESYLYSSIQIQDPYLHSFTEHMHIDSQTRWSKDSWVTANKFLILKAGVAFKVGNPKK